MTSADLFPTNWNDLPDIHEVPPLSDADRACLAEVQEVLRKHGRTHLFGVSLLHKHFDLNDNEIMMEHYDVKARTLTSKPMPVSELADKPYQPTAWRFDRASVVVHAGCAGSYGGPASSHWGYKDD